MHFLASLADKYGPVLVLGTLAMWGFRWSWKREDDGTQLPNTWRAERSLRETRR